MTDIKCDDVKRGLDSPKQIHDLEKISESYNPGFKIEDHVKVATKVSISMTEISLELIT